MTTAKRIAELEARVRELEGALELVTMGQQATARRLGNLQTAINAAIPPGLTPHQRGAKRYQLRRQIAERQRAINSRYAPRKGQR